LNSTLNSASFHTSCNEKIKMWTLYSAWPRKAWPFLKSSFDLHIFSVFGNFTLKWIQSRGTLIQNQIFVENRPTLLTWGTKNEVQHQRLFLRSRKIPTYKVIGIKFIWHEINKFFSGDVFPLGNQTYFHSKLFCIILSGSLVYWPPQVPGRCMIARKSACMVVILWWITRLKGTVSQKSWLVKDLRCQNESFEKSQELKSRSVNFKKYSCS
jgi:hypothetical protein